MLKQKLNDDTKAALKDGNAVKRSVLGQLLSAIKNKELEKRTKLSKTENDPSKLEEGSRLNDDEITVVIQSEIKKRKESAEAYEKGDRKELAAQENSEAEVLASYLPEQASEEKVRTEVVVAIKETGAFGAKDMGKVIATVMARLKGQTDGQTVSRIAKEELAL